MSRHQTITAIMIVISIVVATGQLAFGEDKGADNRANKANKALEELMTKVAASSSGPPPDYNVTEKQKDLLGKAYYDARIKTLEYNMKIFHWQLLSSKLTFVAVMGLMLAGVVFSGYQIFSKRGDQGGPVTELECGPLKIKSPVIGLIVLAFSISFFYYYLKDVYPIEPMQGYLPPADVNSTQQ